MDPRLVGFDYDVSTKRLDLAAALRSTRDAAASPPAWPPPSLSSPSTAVS